MARVLQYKKAGVSLSKGNGFVSAIREVSGIDVGFASLFPLDDRDGIGGGDNNKGEREKRFLVASADGVGTKIMLAQHWAQHGAQRKAERTSTASNDRFNHHKRRGFEGLGQDVVAMCVNDLITTGAKPLFFLDYLACASLDAQNSIELIRGIDSACRASGMILLGGETAELPGIVEQNRFDLCGFVVGMVRQSERPQGHKAMQAGTVLIGLESTGLHSNGFSLVRTVLQQHKGWERETIEHNQRGPILLGEALLEPTALYVDSLDSVRGQFLGAAHITGGGLTDNVPRMLPEGLAAEIDLSCWTRPPIFDWLQEKGGIDETEMRHVFNLGIGMVLAVDAEREKEVLDTLEAGSHRARRIGQLVARSAGKPIRYSGTRSDSSSNSSTSESFSRTLNSPQTSASP